MKTIWKFELKVLDEQKIIVPIGAEILTVQVQYKFPCLWVLVDTTKEKEERIIQMFGTGHPMPFKEGITARKYIGTFLLDENKFVAHVFELMNP